MFLRFVRPNRVAGTSAREGFFCSAYDLRDDPLLDRHASDRLEALLSWFKGHLKIPRTYSRSRSKGRRAAEFTPGLCWFKADAGEAIAKSFELVALLVDHGYPVEIIRTDRVGYILYEDDHQVVAEPFSDTPV